MVVRGLLLQSSTQSRIEQNLTLFQWPSTIDIEKAWDTTLQQLQKAMLFSLFSKSFLIIQQQHFRRKVKFIHATCNLFINDEMSDLKGLCIFRLPSSLTAARESGRESNGWTHQQFLHQFRILILPFLSLREIKSVEKSTSAAGDRGFPMLGHEVGYFLPWRSQIVQAAEGCQNELRTLE